MGQLHQSEIFVQILITHSLKRLEAKQSFPRLDRLDGSPHDRAEARLGAATIRHHLNALASWEIALLKRALAHREPAA
jgi:hypothetical protein